MTQPDASPVAPEGDSPSAPIADQKSEEPNADGVAVAEAEPAPEPWTPERVSEWNAYYDIYVMLAALLLAFVASAVRIDEKNPVIWTHLKTGQLIAEQGSPVLSDSFSYTQTGSRWVNIPWLFQWSHAALYKVVRELVPTDPRDPTANQLPAEQVAIGVLIGLTALVRFLTAWVLINIRHRGPGLWWSAVCVAMALGALLVPFGVPLGVLTGGVALPGMVAPATWGLFFLAIEIFLLFRAYDMGSRRALYGLVPLFVLWANVDQTFIIGLLILAAAVIGRALDGSSAEIPASVADLDLMEQSTNGKAPVSSRRPVSVATGFAILAIAIAACLANPSTHHALIAALAPVRQLFGPESELIRPGEFSYFGKQIQKLYRLDWYWFTVFYLLMVTLGLGSFLLNARRFTWSRFLPFAVMAVLWGVFMGYRQEYAVLFAAIMALNGQEWYHDRFGPQGRLGAGWTIWSVGGRLVTLAALFFCVANIITGWRVVPGQPRFGFSYEPGDFPFEAADYLSRAVDIQGNVLNTTAAQGDAVIWKAYPARRTFYDDRSHLFPQELLEEQRTIRLALKDDDPGVWKEKLDRYEISSVMIDSETAPETYKRLSQSPNWIPFYDDGRVVMFGRADAREPDVTAFRNNRLDPELRAYKVTHSVPAADRPPTPTTWLDFIYQNRYQGRSQPHTGAAVRWLQGTNFDDSQPSSPDAARCLLAIREARTALAANPDDSDAYRLLNIAYRILMIQETALAAGIPLTAENQARINMLAPNIDLLNTRFKQRVTALNYAIQTTPPPRTAEARRELASLNLEMFQLFMQAGYVDLARDRLALVLDQTLPEDFTAEIRSQYSQQLDQLNQRVKQIEDHLLDLQVERQASPIEKAQYARGQGAIGMAIGELEEADRGNMSPLIVKPLLLDLYCFTGQPERALEMLTGGLNEDPNLASEPGGSWIRQGQVYMLLGNYQSAATLWRDRALRTLRSERSVRALTVARIMTEGELAAAASSNLTIPTLVNRQSALEFELGQCLLEAGSPDEAATHFSQSLKLVPDLPFRPIMAYYLGKMGKPVPELSKKEEPAPSKPGAAPAQSPAPPTPPAGAKPSGTAAPATAGPATSGSSKPAGAPSAADQTKRSSAPAPPKTDAAKKKT
jgi:tetratricopeptide (TPR) repeat protein